MCLLPAASVRKTERTESAKNFMSLTFFKLLLKLHLEMIIIASVLAKMTSAGQIYHLLIA